MLTTIFKDLPVGERVKVAELRNLIAEDPAFQNLSTELEEEMKQAVLDHRELKKVGACPTNKSAAQDYRGQLTQMNFEVRFPLAALIFLITLFRLMLCLKERELNWICTPNASHFSQEALDYGMWDIAQLLEQWACTKSKGSRNISSLSAMQKECSSIINGTLSKFDFSYIFLFFNCCYTIETVSQAKTALMNYVNYDAKVVDRYHTKLVGWTYRDFISPFDIHTVDDIRLLAH